MNCQFLFSLSEVKTYFLYERNRRKRNKLSQQRHKTIKVMSQVDGTIMWLFCNIVFAAAFLPSSKSLNISPLLCLGQYYILLSCFLLDKKRYILFGPSSTSCWVEISGRIEDIFCFFDTKYVFYVLSLCMMNILFHII